VGPMKYKEGGTESIAHAYLTERSVCYDAVYTPEGDSVAALAGNADYIEFINEAYLHCKAIAFAKGATSLQEKTLAKEDEGVLLGKDAKDFIAVMKKHRVWSREKARKVPA
jgi:catalase